MESIAKVQIELYTLKNNVIGLFKINGNFELVVENSNGTFITLNITQFGATQETVYYSYNNGEFKQFPYNRNMNEMLNNPFEFDVFIKSFS